MKRFAILLVFGLLAMTVTAQKVYEVTADTVKGAETVNFDFAVSKGNTNLVFQALFTEVGGTSDGTATLQFSVDGTSYVTYADAVHNDFVRLFAKDSSKIANLGNEFTVTDTGVFGGWIKDSPYQYIRIPVAGTSGDTTAVNVKWMYK